MAEPGISILLPFRDALETLEECLDSIAGQTFTDYELLALDDGSRDAGPALVRARAERDPRIRLIDSGGRGLVATLNLGLERARAPLIARMDADDLMRPTRLRRQFELMTQGPELALVACQTRKFPKALVKTGYRAYIDWQNALITPADIAAELYVESPLPHPSVMFRKDLIRELGGYRDGQFPEDYELWLRIHAAGHPMGKVPEVLLDWRESPGRLSRVDPRYGRAAFDRLRADYLAREPVLLTALEAGRPLMIWGAGRPARRRAELLLERGFKVSGWLDVDPAKIGKHHRDAPVHPPAVLDKHNGAKPFVLSYVNNHGARPRIATFLAERGYVRGTDYLMVG